MARRRSFNVFNLAFLDIMSCGLGAVILFFMVINASSSKHADEVLSEKRSEADRLEVRVMAGQKNLVQLRNKAADLMEKDAVAKGLARQMVTDVADAREELARLDAQTTAKLKNVEQLKSDLKSMEQESKRLSAQSVTPEEAGDRIRNFVGEGNRQYLTGLRMGGERILILVDTSASMLDDTIVNIVRRKNMPYKQKIRSPKWQQTLATVDWLTAQIPIDSQYQLFGFSSEAKPLLEGTGDHWLKARDTKQLDEAVKALHRLEPGGSTSLDAAIEVMNSLKPKPDNVYLITDGLPTQGAVIPTSRTVTGRERLRHFQRAVRHVPLNVPINVVLFPLEGDPNAPAAYWQLALTTHGSFLSPSTDWP